MTRRRRRVLIVSGVLVLLIGGLWWRSPPPIDPRFVGTWSWQVARLPGVIPASSNATTLSTITLNADGSGTIQPASGPPNPIRWSVGENNKFTYRAGLAYDVLNLWMTLRAKVLGKRYLDGLSWRILSVADERIEFDLNGDSAPEFVFKRVSPAGSVR
jgi:hypothetical protein